MKKVLISATAVFIVLQGFSQVKKSEITKKNSWLKVGLNAGAPVGKSANQNYSSFVGGIEVSAQLMRTHHFGIGISSGYNQFFANKGYDNFGTVPLDAMLRFYPRSKGLFIGVNGGYTFITNQKVIDGGLNVTPQLGYHNYSWNIYGFYNRIFINETNFDDIQNIGIAATYNLRFNKKHTKKKARR